jgi:hypothetical protein
MLVANNYFLCTMRSLSLPDYDSLLIITSFLFTFLDISSRSPNTGIIVGRSLYFSLPLCFFNLSHSLHLYNTACEAHSWCEWATLCYHCFLCEICVGLEGRGDCQV